jgi:hypothetical protein
MTQNFWAQRAKVLGKSWKTFGPKDFLWTYYVELLADGCRPKVRGRGRSLLRKLLEAASCAVEPGLCHPPHNLDV